MNIKSDLFLHLLDLQIEEFTKLYMSCEMFTSLSYPERYRRIDGLARIEEVIDGEASDKVMVYYCCKTWDEYKELAKYALVHIARVTREYPHSL